MSTDSTVKQWSLTEPYRKAREVLGLSGQEDQASIKRAWRKAATAHPPDQDPERFRTIREAYELLSDPLKRAHELLLQPTPCVPAPELPELPPPPPPHSLAVELLRCVVGRLRTADLLPPQTSRTSTPPDNPS